METLRFFAYKVSVYQIMWGSVMLWLLMIYKRKEEQGIILLILMILIIFLKKCNYTLTARTRSFRVIKLFYGRSSEFGMIDSLFCEKNPLTLYMWRVGLLMDDWHTSILYCESNSNKLHHITINYQDWHYSM